VRLLHASELAGVSSRDAGIILAGWRGPGSPADGVETPKPLVEVGGRPQIVNLIETFQIGV